MTSLYKSFLLLFCGFLSLSLTVFGVSKALGSICQSRGLPQVAVTSRWRLHFLLVCCSLDSSHGSGGHIKREFKGGATTPPDKNWKHAHTTWSLSGLPAGESQWHFYLLPALERLVSITKLCSHSDLPRQSNQNSFIVNQSWQLLVFCREFIRFVVHLCSQINNIRALNSRIANSTATSWCPMIISVYVRTFSRQQFYKIMSHTIFLPVLH